MGKMKITCTEILEGRGNNNYIHCNCIKKNYKLCSKRNYKFTVRTCGNLVSEYCLYV